MLFMNSISLPVKKKSPPIQAKKKNLRVKKNPATRLSRRMNHLRTKDLRI
jgi:hypothetical protein